MGLWDAAGHKAVMVPWEKLAKSNRKKLFEIRRADARYYLIGGERPQDNYHDKDTLIILEIDDDERARILEDSPGYKIGNGPGHKLHLDRDVERLRITKVSLEALRLALGFDLGSGEVLPEYDPKTHYVVSREKPGRPRRVLTDEERQRIMSMRAQGLSVNEIAKAAKVSNRLVMAALKEVSDD